MEAGRRGLQAGAEEGAARPCRRVVEAVEGARGQNRSQAAGEAEEDRQTHLPEAAVVEDPLHRPVAGAAATHPRQEEAEAGDHQKSQRPRAEEAVGVPLQKHLEEVAAAIPRTRKRRPAEVAEEGQTM